MEAPEMRSPATLAHGRANSQLEFLRSSCESDTTSLEFQARKLRRTFYFSLATALTVATLAYGGKR
jgi:hypothetical protein